ncbi:MAG: choice-of-anchor D domain-containing protein [Deltaproteobacteria bacterium]|nr:choice-of-anchor D domain-containing protein [Deltaproteobacteria bacterium]
MKGIKRVIYPILPLVILCFLLFPGNSSAGVATDVIDFGQVLVGEQVTRGLAISNGAATTYVIYVELFNSATESFSVDYSGDYPIVLGSGESREILITYSPTTVGIDTGTLTIKYYEGGWTPKGTEEVGLKGEGVEEIVPETLIINGRDTGIIDHLYGDQPVSAWIEECKVNAKNQGQYVKCVFILTNKLKKAGLITAKEKRIIRKEIILAVIKEKREKFEHYSWKKRWKEKHRDAEYRRMRRWLASR